MSPASGQVQTVQLKRREALSSRIPVRPRNQKDAVLISCAVRTRQFQHSFVQWLNLCGTLVNSAVVERFQSCQEIFEVLS
ncbi:hypothetical protein K443DRAFT_670901 [Laccaria amethystina LaAM-08-1]|uniref:Uncharacterized protein n=1 Tax=Laccaria amethystina LaAM-08-1 TaxID=1095629 RepID=A0A0C9Y8B4_9AGAR|nr:hypothetical protein K443DRAFT_670901 [Laccaria amethystina LaAM-08-1]